MPATATTATRFAALPAPIARAILTALALLVAIGLAWPPPAAPGGRPGAGDAALYRAIADRVRSGEAYHVAATAEQRARGYPARPLIAVRPPALTEIEAWLGPAGTGLLLRLLVILAASATVMRLSREPAGGSRWASMLLAATAGGVMAAPAMWIWHEAWAGLLVALSLACRGDRYEPSVLLGLAATLMRELALPFLFVMGIGAWRSGRRREAWAWAIATAIALAAFGAHAVLAAAAARPGDAVSPGWLAAGGWRFDLALARHCGLFLLLPRWVTAVATPLALLGWAGRRSDYAVRGAALLAIWLASFLLVGRPDNDYWGFLLAPLLPIGLAWAPAALHDLARAAALPGRASRARLAPPPLSGESAAPVPDCRRAPCPSNPIAGSASTHRPPA